MLISVIIPTYNPKDYLRECLLSLENQSLDKAQIEILIVLNGCKEPYYTRIQEFIKNEMPTTNVSLIQVDEGGVSNARNIGIEKSNGDYIAFIDDDDYVSSTYFEELLLASTKTSIGCSNTVSFDDETKIINWNYRGRQQFIEKKKDVSLSQASRYFNGPVMKLVHKSIIGESRFDKSLKNEEDSLFMFEISCRIKSVSFTSSNAIYYRRFRRNSASTGKKTIVYSLNNWFIFIKKTTLLYLKDVSNYSFQLWLNRLAASTKTMMLRVAGCNY